MISKKGTEIICTKDDILDNIGLDYDCFGLLKRFNILCNLPRGKLLMIDEVQRSINDTKKAMLNVRIGCILESWNNTIPLKEKSENYVKMTITDIEFKHGCFKKRKMTSYAMNAGVYKKKGAIVGK